MQFLPNIDELSTQQLSKIKNDVRDWCWCNAMIKRKAVTCDDDALEFQLTPITLLPSAIPKKVFEQAVTTQLDFNHLYDILTRKPGFLYSSLKSCLNDDFSSKLLNIYKQVLDEGIAQPINFMLVRSDYMLDLNNNGNINHPLLKQVEFNTIACGGVGSGNIRASLHRHVLRDLGQMTNESIAEHIKDNEPLEPFAKGIRKAWELYGNKEAIILFVVVFDDPNLTDQRRIEFAINKEDSWINIIRCTLADIKDNCILDDEKTLYYQKQEVALTYYRVGYLPKFYPSQKEWDARLLVERSRCIKCPNIACQLTGLKKMQQVIAESGVLESLVSDQSSIERMRSTFAGLYSLEGENSQNHIEMAKKSPEKFVLKPPLEGGGNNLYDEDIPKFFNSATSSDEYSSYILMDRIHPPETKNCIIKADCQNEKIIEVVNELGIFGVYISCGSNEIITNCSCGYVLRTKSARCNEGGTLSGEGALDTVYLV